MVLRDFRQADALLPGQPMIQLGLARSLIERAQGEDLQEAIGILRSAVGIEPRNAGAHRFLGIALGRTGQIIEADLAFAESAILRRQPEDADIYLNRAKRAVSNDNPNWLKLQDLMRARRDL